MQPQRSFALFLVPLITMMLMIAPSFAHAFRVPFITPALSTVDELSLMMDTLCREKEDSLLASSSSSVGTNSHRRHSSLQWLLPSLAASEKRFLLGKALVASSVCSQTSSLEDRVLRLRDALKPLLSSDSDSPPPYFRFQPTTKGRTVPISMHSGQPRPTNLIRNLTFTTRCNRTATVQSTVHHHDNYTKTKLHVRMYTVDGNEDKKEGGECVDQIQFFGVSTIEFIPKTVTKPGLHTWAASLRNDTFSQASWWYLMNRGVMVLEFGSGSMLTVLYQLIETGILMAGFGQKPLSNATLTANVDFMHHYVQSSVRMQPLSSSRPAGSAVANYLLTLNNSALRQFIRSGDAIAVLRYDGLDPFLGWAEGFTGGHSAIAVWNSSASSSTASEQQLFICETTVKGAYWPVNGVQCTPFHRWVQIAEAAQLNVLIVPLGEKESAAFDEAKAWAFFAETVGTDYGFPNFLMGWMDVPKDNFPCLPPDFTNCETEAFEELKAITLDAILGNNEKNVYRYALNKRTGTNDLDVVQIFRFASENLNLTTYSDLYTMPEQDKWRYSMKRSTNNGSSYIDPNARSMVCCVFVCHMWKHAGVLRAGGMNSTNDNDGDDGIQCSEQTLWDIFSMKLFDTNRTGAQRPSICTSNDPTNPLCQLMGDRTFQIHPDFNTRPLYSHMGERCPSKAPEYLRPQGC